MATITYLQETLDRTWQKKSPSSVVHHKTCIQYTPTHYVLGIAVVALTFMRFFSSFTCILALLLIIAAQIIKEYVNGTYYIGEDKLMGKTVVITGANTGVGKATAIELARRGGRIIMGCRSLRKGEETVKEIIKQTGNFKVECRELNLASMDSIRNFCKSVNQSEDQIDILINNAAVAFIPWMVTEQGIEMQFGVNYVGHFLLTKLLMDKLKVAAPSRIILLSSVTHYFKKIDFDNINNEKKYNRFSSYCQSKAAILLFMLELHKQLAGSGVTVNSVNPGSVGTEIFRNVGDLCRPLVQFIYILGCHLLLKSPFQGSQTTLLLAIDSSLENVSGKYFSDCEETSPALHTLDDVAAKQLWNITEKWTEM